MTFFSDPYGRLRTDWAHFADLTKGRDSNGHPPSLDIALLRRVRHDSDLFAFDAERFAAICPGWDEIRKSLEERNEKPVAMLPTAGLKFLNLWPEIERQLKSLNELETEEAERLAEAVFALSSMTGSLWFMNEAIRINENVLGYYKDICERQLIDRDHGEAKPAVDTDQEDGASEPSDESVTHQAQTITVKHAADPSVNWSSPVLPAALLTLPSEVGPHGLLGARVSEIATMLSHPVENWTNIEMARTILSRALEVLESAGIAAQLNHRQARLRAEIISALSPDIDALQPFAQSLDALERTWLTQIEPSNDSALESDLAGVEAALSALTPLMDSVRTAAARLAEASAAVAATRELTRDPTNFAARRMLADQQHTESTADLELVNAQEALLHALKIRAKEAPTSPPPPHRSIIEQSAMWSDTECVALSPEPPLINPENALSQPPTIAPVEREPAASSAQAGTDTAVGKPAPEPNLTAAGLPGFRTTSPPLLPESPPPAREIQSRETNPEITSGVSPNELMVVGALSNPAPPERTAEQRADARAACSCIDSGSPAPPARRRRCQ